MVAVTDGFIERLHEGGSAGRAIYLRAGNGKQYFYAHLEDIAVAEMEAVRAGDLVGYVGDSGNARRTTPHLHFEIMVGQREAIDPLPYLSAASVLPSLLPQVRPQSQRNPRQSELYGPICSARDRRAAAR